MLIIILMFRIVTGIEELYARDADGISAPSKIYKKGTGWWEAG